MAASLSRQRSTRSRRRGCASTDRRPRRRASSPRRDRRAAPTELPPRRRGLQWHRPDAGRRRSRRRRSSSSAVATCPSRRALDEHERVADAGIRDWSAQTYELAERASSIAESATARRRAERRVRRAEHGRLDQAVSRSRPGSLDDGEPADGRDSRTGRTGRSCRRGPASISRRRERRARNRASPYTSAVEAPGVRARPRSRGPRASADAVQPAVHHRQSSASTASPEARLTTTPVEGVVADQRAERPSIARGRRGRRRPSTARRAWRVAVDRDLGPAAAIAADRRRRRRASNGQIGNDRAGRTPPWSWTDRR